MPTRKHLFKKWEVSLLAFRENGRKRFKVTRRLPDLSVSETRIFTDKKKAEQLFDEWLE
jgi:hypothetical protein